MNFNLAGSGRNSNLWQDCSQDRKVFLVLGQKQMYFSNTVVIFLLNIDLHLKKVGLS